VRLSDNRTGWIQENLVNDIAMPEMTAQKNFPLYAGPGTNYSRVGEIARGQKYVLIKEENEWYQIQLSLGIESWVPAEVFSPSKAQLVFTLDKANIRSGPGIDYSVIQTIQPAVNVRIIGEEENWYYVQLKDVTKGYIRKDLVFEE